ncbi:hypothetical protein [Schinkia azotoformans]|uniref:hypothetical protein n=1 Tax=Schinkia azotoformans TaxID=1454 RepID=UPI002DBCCA60|nr:hypothetical protein [Schinkia azotoformans]MEC1770134.1 hypothetical protein [Schinkia azotoformans]MED4365774.1 hypothetical protein [Schinkia azotoformans]
MKPVPFMNSIKKIELYIFSNYKFLEVGIFLHKAVYPLAVITVVLGLLLFVPLKLINGIIYLIIFYTHITIGAVLAVMLFRIIKTHVLVELGNPFKLRYKKWNGFKLLLYLFITILSGVVIVLFHIQWILYFHGFIGLWVLLVGWKHKKANAHSSGLTQGSEINIKLKKGINGS